ncbi:Calx-beta domain-containing protein [Zeaxanthinibacter sp. PT1]|uniref:Calx-beta domain-containing protein n=1 Tax=Zeaxanthinibacter TaxID=561554 RepID=UPI00234AE856|nr:Calx-beta domain-containing protein [Zeaxanthinibacter sp. PT1]MDC6352367.1 Calx-beta domain-containing protein [Zeaxanthinibacter sp. PT1]
MKSKITLLLTLLITNGLLAQQAILSLEITGDYNVEYIEGEDRYKYLVELDEGNSLPLLIHTESENGLQGTTVDLEYEIAFGTTATPDIDFIASPSSPVPVVINESVGADGELDIEALIDNINDPGEVIILDIPKSTSTNNYYIEGPGEIDSSTFIEIEIKINSVATADIVAEITNTGSFEQGTNEVITVTLFDSEGNLWANNTNSDIIFPISFTPDENSGNPAEIEDFTALANQVIIAPGDSSGSVEVMLNGDTDLDHDFFLATLSDPGFTEPINLPPPLQVKILDQNGQYIIHMTVKTPNAINPNYVGDAIYVDDAACCPEYQVEEGEIFEIAFEGEKGLPEDTEYPFSVLYEAGGSVNGHPQAEEGLDFRNRAGTNELTFNVDVNDDPDNVLQISILSPAIEPDKSQEGTEQFDLIVQSNDSRFIMGFTWTVVILETTAVTVTSPDNLADEENAGTDNGLFLFELQNALDNDITVYFEVGGNAEEGVDYEPITRSLYFPSGQTQNFIDLVALQDDLVEEDELVTITLIEGSGYSINDSNKSASVTIPRNDQDKVAFDVSAGVVASPIYEDPARGNSGVFEISLDKPNDTGIDVRVNYTFSDLNDANAAERGLDFSAPENDFVVFGPGESVKEVVITALEDGLEENNERVNLVVTAGERYQVIESTATLEIISTEFDTSSLDANALKVTSSSDSCAGSAEGDINVKNNSGFQFIVQVNGGSVTEISNLPANGEITFRDLPSGYYDVFFEFQDPEIEIIPPSFSVTIEELQGTNLLAQSVDLGAKVALLSVSGSEQYTVTTKDGREYSYQVDGPSKQVLKVPLSEGLNELEIKGAQDCQGIIKTAVSLKKIYVYPNPTQDVITLNGFTDTASAALSLFDTSGNVLQESQLDIQGGMLSIDLSSEAPGVYFGRLYTEKGEEMNFKFIKK